MSDSAHYIQQVETYSRKAAVAETADERSGYLALAATYAQLAREAAQYEAQWGRSLTQDVD